MIPEINDTLEGPPTNFFGTVRQKNSQEYLDTSLSLLFINFFANRTFLKHSTKGFLYDLFRHCETEKIRLKILILPPPSFSSTNFFATGNFPKHGTEQFPFKDFGTARQKNSTKKRDIFLLGIKFFDTRNQWHPRRFPYEFFRHCETKRFRQNFLILPTPSFSSTNFFATRNFPKHITERSPFKVFWHCETKKIEQKSWINPLKHKVFPYPKSVTP